MTDIKWRRLIATLGRTILLYIYKFSKFFHNRPYLEFRAKIKGGGGGRGAKIPYLGQSLHFCLYISTHLPLFVYLCVNLLWKWKDWAIPVNSSYTNKQTCFLVATEFIQSWALKKRCPHQSQRIIC